MTELMNNSRSVQRRRPTIKDIAARANVSSWTVSQVLRGQTGSAFSQATRDRIHAIAQEIDYRPNLAAVALNTSKTALVEVWVCTAIEYSPFSGWIFHTLQKVAAQHGYRCIAENIPMDQSWRDNDLSLQWPVDGIIAIDSGGPVRGHLKAHPNDTTPIVNMGAGSGTETDRVYIDLGPGYRAACQHLLEQNCRRVAYLGRLPEDVRWRAYEQVMTEAGRPVEVILANDDTTPCAYETFRNYVREHGAPDGLVCHNDSTALGAFGAACALGLSIPSDIAFVGCDGLPDTLYNASPLSTVQLDAQEYCELGWQMLLSRMEDPNLPKREWIVTPELVVRGSSQRLWKPSVIRERSRP
ncbi:MAG: LacI family DNA-binding transcriptional regulator [Capsulimonadaceae bacterium]|nr:LacI family DNA-binding transcriptional regulator [Capsulimonadaceae bacterium]